MPLTLNTPQTVVIDTAKITQFTVTPESRQVTIHYSLGFIDTSGNFIVKENNKIDLVDVEFEQALHDSVKSTLYSLLNSNINQDII